MSEEEKEILEKKVLKLMDSRNIAKNLWHEISMTLRQFKGCEAVPTSSQLRRTCAEVEKQMLALKCSCLARERSMGGTGGDVELL